ncbi:MAG: hypothetical protein JNJ59_01660 [Deltaproteobacteria bacterium]|nr:hypothetical protein [Deltaproteobacteria bacterium]
MPAPSQSMLPSGTTPVFYTCNEHELTFDLWQEVLPGQMVRIPYRFTR